MVLAQAKFAYNNSMNRSTSKTPFKTISGMKDRGISNLKNVGEEKRSAEGEEFSKYISSLHKEVKLKLEQSNHKYKENDDRRRKHHYLEVGDEVMVYLKKRIFFVGTYSKLRMRKFGPCKILRKFDSGNAYEVESLDDISYIQYC